MQKSVRANQKQRQTTPNSNWNGKNVPKKKSVCPASPPPAPRTACDHICFSLTISCIGFSIFLHFKTIWRNEVVAQEKQATLQMPTQLQGDGEVGD